MALPELIANQGTAGKLTALTTLGAEAKSTDKEITTAAAAPAALQSSGASQFRIIVGKLNEAGEITEGEIMVVTGGATTTKWKVLRGSEVTDESATPTAKTHASGSSVFHLVTSGTLKNLPPYVDANRWPGVDPTGTVDSTAGLMAAIEFAAKEGRPCRASGTFKIGMGGTGINFASMTWPLVKIETEPWKAVGLERIEHIVLDFSAARFIGSSSLGTNPMLNLAPPTGVKQFFECDFKLGYWEQLSKTGMVITSSSVGNSKIDAITEFGTYSIYVKQKGLKVFWGNNTCNFEVLDATEGGLVYEAGVLGEGGAPSNQISGNLTTVYCGAPATNAAGVFCDTVAGNCAEDNIFIVKVSEGPNWGVIDHNGRNIWLIGNTGANASGGFFLPPGAQGPPFVIGRMEGTVNLEGQPAFVYNLFNELMVFPGKEFVSGTHIKALTVTKSNLTKALQEELLKVAEFPAPGAYTSGTEETETTATYVSLIIKTKAEVGSVKAAFVNDGHEVVYEWNNGAATAAKIPLNFMVKHGGKWKVTLSGAAESATVAKQTIESV